MKAEIAFMPSAPVTTPMRKEPTSITIEPLSMTSRKVVPSIRVSPVRASQSAAMIAGVSIAAATATM
jgi:hypothetical protein